MGVSLFRILLCLFNLGMISFANPTILKVGVLLDPMSETQDLAVKKGVEAANDLLNNTNFRIEAVGSSDNEFGSSYATAMKVCNLLDQGIIGIIGPSNPKTADHVLSMATTYEIPNFQLVLNLHRRLEPFSINLYPHYVSYGQALLDFLGTMDHWVTITIIYSDSSSLIKFQEVIRKIDRTLHLRIWKGIDVEETRTMMKYTKDSPQRSFIVDIPIPKVKEFVDMAASYNMTDNYNFVFTTWDILLMNPQVFQPIIAANITTFTLTQYTNFNESLSSHSSYAEMMWTEINVKNGESSKIKTVAAKSVQMDVALIFDYFMLLAHALIKATEQKQMLSESILKCDELDRSWPNGLAFLNRIKEAEIEYQNPLTGPLYIDSNGFRSNFTMYAVEIHKERFNREITQYGYWNSAGFTIVKNASETTLEAKKALENLTVIVTTKCDPPFVIYNEDNNKVAKGCPPNNKRNFSTNPDDWDGVVIKILKEIARELKFVVKIVHVHDNEYGKELSKDPPKYSGMIGQILEKKARVAAAALTINHDRGKLMDFTHPFMGVGISIVYRSVKDPISVFAFLEPLSQYVWGYIFAAYILVSIIMFVIARFSPYEWFNPLPCKPESETLQNPFTLLNTMWWMVNSLLRQGCDLAPRSTSVRILTGFWAFFSLIIISSYTANLAAFLTNERMKVSVDSAEALSKQSKISYGLQKGGSTQQFFEKSEHPVYKIMNDVMKLKASTLLVSSTPQGIAKVQKENYAFILESVMNDFYRERDCELVRIGQSNLDSKSYGFAVQKGDLLRASMSEIILKMQNEQKLDNITKYWLKEWLIDAKCPVEEKDTGATAMGIRQVGGVFALLVSGILIGVIASWIEYYCKIKFGTENKNVCKEVCNDLRFAFSCKKTVRYLTNKQSSGHEGPQANRAAAQLQYSLQSYVPPTSSSQVAAPNQSNLRFSNDDVLLDTSPRFTPISPPSYQVIQQSGNYNLPYSEVKLKKVPC